jgi:hypothetical protein
MNLRIGILIVGLIAGAQAQSPAVKKGEAASAKKAVAVQASPAGKKSAAAQPKGAQPKTAPAKQAPAAKASAAAPKAGQSKPAEPKAAAVNAATAVNAPAPGSKRISGKRDPFVSPVSDRNNEPIDCGSGKRCLVPDQTILRGIVKAPSGMIAVVTNPQEKAYFLRENDPVYNGYVLRITPNTVVFRETVEDRLGRKSTREVVKKVNAPVV